MQKGGDTEVSMRTEKYPMNHKFCSGILNSCVTKDSKTL